MQRARRLTYFLIAGIAVLAGAISWQIGSRPASIDVDGAPIAASSALLPEPPAAVFELAVLAAYDEIVKRPLFSQTRRPPAPEIVTSAPVTPSKPRKEPVPDWKLVGTAITAVKQAALIWDKRNRRFVRLEPGMKQSGWEIAEVQPETIVLSKGKVNHEIKLPRF